jgi:hypothetical protein
MERAASRRVRLATSQTNRDWPVLRNRAVQFVSVEVRATQKKKEKRMRILVAALLVMTAFPALADDADDARRLAVSGRDAYWNCLAREYPRDANKNMPEQEFAALISAACASERQNFRVALVDYLGTQSGNDAGANMTTANNAIAFAQKDVVTAFARRKAAAK